MRRHLLCLILALAAILAPAGAAAATGQSDAPVILRPEATVKGPVVQLGDLFEGLGERAATPIARAPEPGRSVEVDARWLAAVAQAYGVAWRPRSALDRIVIARASRTIDTPRIEEALLDALAERGLPGEVSLVLDNPTLRLDLPAEAPASLAVSGLSYDPVGGRFTAYVSAPAEGSPLARVAVSGRAVTLTEIPVLRRNVTPGEVIGEQDIVWTSWRTDRLGRGIALDSGRLVGMSARRPLRAGEAVRLSDLRSPVLVPKNSLVTIRLATPRMVLTAQGKALEEGSDGDVIRVMNTKSNTVINAGVVEAGLVEVQAGANAALN